MAMHVIPNRIGVDVAKDELVLYDQAADQVFPLPNTKAAIRRWLKGLPENSHMALEATGIYHLELAEQAHAAGHLVFIINGYQLNHYRESMGRRAKTDASDARLLADYLQANQRRLRPWTPPPKAYCTLQRLLRRRATLVQARVALQQSWKEGGSLKALIKPVLAHMDRLDQALQKRLRLALREAGLQAERARCQALEGVGELTATALVMAFLRGDFRTSDAFIAFLGLDLRVRQSSKREQRRRLTKRGDAEVRRLLHNAAMAASRSPRWHQVYEGYLQRGLKKTQALVILARKLARIAFALMKHKTLYQSEGQIA
ncbi:IS110 family transposase [Alcanivorax sp. 24]|uniref:IS110 family transposase n=1 Tax=Alcanivorax sp. 24 TaxID=2545266 RepID=UPI0010622256|nr:IS110 family transposase [Alcanivorax sp. 24]